MKLALALFATAPLFAQLSIPTTSIPNGTVGKPYAVGLTVSGGSAPYSWAATAGTVPPGLTVTNGGTIVGTPTVAGSYGFTVTVTDARQATAVRTLTVTIAVGSVSIATSALPVATANQPYSMPLVTSGGTPPYHWAAGTGFPGGLTLDPQSGVISGTPTAAGTFSFSVQVTDSVQATSTGNFTLTVNPAPLSITTVAPLFAGTVGVPYSQPFAAAGGKTPYTWSIASGNTGGLTLDSASGTLRGTPQAAGTFNFVVQVVDSAGATASASFSVVVNAPVLTIAVGSALPAGIVGAPYNQQVPVVATGGTAPYQWSLAPGSSVVPGLSFDGNALTLSGTPTTAGTFSFTVQVADANRSTASKSLSVTIAPPALTITTSRQLPDGALNAAYTASVAAVGGALPYTWSATGLPAGLSIDPSTGTIAGTPTAAGNFPIAITVTDSALNHYSDRFTLNINLPTTPGVTISGLPATASPAQQYPIQVTLASTFPAPITGTAILTFSPDTGPTDQTIQFASGGTTATFSIPAGATTATSDVPLAIQTGTASGTINISIRLQAGGIDITPLPAPAVSTQISRAAPVITSVQLTRSSGSINVVVSGYSTAREVVQATFAFGASSGQTLQSTASSVSVSVETLFGNWFQNPANSAYGTQFVMTQPFTIQGDPNAVLLQSVTLMNRVGSVTYQVQQ